jgi:hypothetical protein
LSGELPLLCSQLVVLRSSFEPPWVKIVAESPSWTNTLASAVSVPAKTSSQSWPAAPPLIALRSSSKTPSSCTAFTTIAAPVPMTSDNRAAQSLRERVRFMYLISFRRERRGDVK